jgi:hypothetical protein
MTYSFTLNWDELDSDLRETKIQEYIEANYKDYAYDYAVNHYDGDDLNSQEFIGSFAGIHVANLLADETTYRDAERSIEARFPIYF